MLQDAIARFEVFGHTTGLWVFTGTWNISLCSVILFTNFKDSYTLFSFFMWFFPVLISYWYYQKKKNSWDLAAFLCMYRVTDVFYLNVFLFFVTVITWSFDESQLLSLQVIGTTHIAYHNCIKHILHKTHVILPIHIEISQYLKPWHQPSIEGYVMLYYFQIFSVLVLAKSLFDAALPTKIRFFWCSQRL